MKAVYPIILFNNIFVGHNTSKTNNILYDVIRSLGEKGTLFTDYTKSVDRGEIIARGDDYQLIEWVSQ